MSHFPGIFREHATISQDFRIIFLNLASLSILKKNLHFLDESEAKIKNLGYCAICATQNKETRNNCMKRFSTLRVSRGIKTWSTVCTYAKRPCLWAFPVLSAPLLSFLITVTGRPFSLVLFPILSLTFNAVLLGKARIPGQSMQNLPLRHFYLLLHCCLFST